jgi:hypothetical protein
LCVIFEMAFNHLFELSLAVFIPLVFIIVGDLALKYLIYGTPTYKTKYAKSLELESRVDRTEREERELKEIKSSLQSTWTFLIPSFSVLLMWWTSSSLLGGRIVALLPFEPPSLFGIRSWFHGTIPVNTLTGEINWKEAAYLPIVFCSNLFWRFIMTSFFPFLSGAPTSAAAVNFDMMSWVNSIQQQRLQLQQQQQQQRVGLKRS